MSSSLSKQLAGIAATSTNQLDLRAQRHAHADSLLFDPKVAATQDFDSIYDYCVVGFQDLCRIEPRFSRFSNTIFSEVTKTRERGQLTPAENAELNAVIERFLILSCKYLLLQPTQKALEWLIRRFRVHEHNTETLVLSFLIYHPLPIFSTLLSILPKKLPRSLKFLHPYQQRLQAPSGEIIQHAASTNSAFFTSWTAFVMKSCKWEFQHEPMISYWTIRTASAVESQLGPVKAGGVQAQRHAEEDVIRNITGILDKALAFRQIPSMLIGCFVIIERLVMAANLNDATISTFMDTIASAATPELYNEAIVALVHVCQKLKSRKLSKLTFDFIMNFDDIVDKLAHRAKTLPSESFTASLTMELIQRLSSKGVTHQIRTLLRLLTSGLLNETQLETALRTMIQLLGSRSRFTTNGYSDTDGLKDVLIQFYGSALSKEASNVAKELLDKIVLDASFLAILKDAISPTAIAVNVPILEDTIMANHQFEPSGWTDDMPVDVAVPSSYLTGNINSAFDQLAIAFTKLPRSSDGLSQFLDSRYLRSDSEDFPVRPISFLLRYSFSSLPQASRIFAISCISHLIQSLKDTVDTQFLLPYALVGLAERSSAIRDATAQLLVAMQSGLKHTKDTTEFSLTAQEIYELPEGIHGLSTSLFRSILRTMLDSRLEECKMDHQAVKSLVKEMLSGNIPEEPQVGVGKLRKVSRAAFLSFLADHARATPILHVASSLSILVTGIHKAGLVSTSEAFQPLLEKWTLMEEGALRAVCIKQKLRPEAFCADVVGLVVPSSNLGNQLLQKLLVNTESAPFIDSIFGYVTKFWTSINSTAQYAWASLLFEKGVLNKNGSTLSQMSLESLRSLQLNSEILQDFLERVTSSISETDIGSPNNKRRRTNYGATESPDSKTIEQLKIFSARSEIVLGLVSNADSVVKHALLPGLFRIFQILHKSKSALQNDLNYIHWLLLTCLREIVERSQRSQFQTFDHSSVRVDLIVDTLTHTTDLQTQFAALTLLSALAKLDPELIIHSMMPVFTFMGSSILKQDSDHAAYVIDQMIDSVIPPLIDSFKRHKGSALSGVSGIILSFVAAFEHILPSRRIDLFSALVDKLGAEEYLSLLFLALKDRYGDQDIVREFLSAMMLKYSPITGLKTIQRCIEIFKDSLKPRPILLKQIFLSDTDSPSSGKAVALAELPVQLLRTPQLSSLITKTLRNDSSGLEAMRSSYASMVRDTLEMTLLDHGTKEISDCIATILGTLVAFFPVAESLRALDAVLRQSNEDLHREVLDSFAVAIQRAQAGHAESRSVSIQLLPSLVSVVENSKDSDVVVNAIRCMSGIVRKYGKTDSRKVLELAGFLVGPKALQNPGTSIQQASLEAFVAVVLALGEEMVPLCPIVISKSLDHLSVAISGDEWNAAIHNAAYSLLTVLLSNIPWMITGPQLDRFLDISYLSASTSTDEGCDEKRIASLLSFAENSSAQTCFQALLRNWTRCVELAGPATNEHLQILETAIEKHSKATIVSNVTILTDHFVDIMGLRALRMDPGSDDWDETQVDDVEETASSILIKMIYKLNDTHFRPQFARISGWATSSGVKDEVSTIRRLTSWFAFLEKFFQTLQSIVVNYATYIVEPAIGILTSMSPNTLELRRLWEKTIGTLHATFEHDRDDFWKSPSRFSDICGPLVNQLVHIPVLKDDSLLVPCITAFAVAVESSEQRAEIHARILQNSKAEDARTRCAMFSCEIALTEALGDEWISLFDSSSTYPVMSEALEDDDEDVENEVRKWKLQIEELTGESLDGRLQ